MANALYDLGREAFLDGDIDWAADNIKVLIVDGAVYTPNLVTDQFRDDIASEVAVSANLSGKDSSLGVADAADVTFSTVSGAQSEFLVIFKDTGTPATSALIALIDTATGLPVTPDGGDITVTWDSGANKIFKL